MKYLDCHTHLNFSNYNDDRKAVIADMKDQEVGAINIGTDAETSRESARLAEDHDHIWASVGCHPTEAQSFSGVSVYQQLIRSSDQVVAVGECGLDYSRPEYRSDEQQSLQEDVFTDQIKLALRNDLPLVLHIRPSENSLDAYEDGLDILTHFHNQHDTTLAGTAHFFVGTKSVAEQFLDLGLYISFTGPVTHDRRLQDVAGYIPKNRLLAETDSPFAAPTPHRGERNLPLYVKRIVSQLAELHDTDPAVCARTLLGNTVRLFGLSSVETGASM